MSDKFLQLIAEMIDLTHLSPCRNSQTGRSSLCSSWPGSPLGYRRGPWCSPLGPEPSTACWKVCGAASFSIIRTSQYTTVDHYLLFLKISIMYFLWVFHVSMCIISILHIWPSPSCLMPPWTQLSSDWSLKNDFDLAQKKTLTFFP